MVNMEKYGKNMVNMVIFMDKYGQLWLIWKNMEKDGSYGLYFIGKTWKDLEHKDQF